MLKVKMRTTRRNEVREARGGRRPGETRQWGGSFWGKRRKRMPNKFNYLLTSVSIVCLRRSLSV